MSRRNSRTDLYGTDIYGALAENAPMHVRVPPAPAEESAGPPLSDFVVELQRTTQALHELYVRTSRLWELYRETAADVTAAASIVLNLNPVLQGWEAEIERITISVGGSNAAAVMTVFRRGVHEASLLYVLPSLVGTGPSRGVVDLNQPIRLMGGENLVIALTGVTGAGNQCYCRAEGRKREL